MEASLPRNEKERLKALEACAILDTPPEQMFDDIALLASRACQTPMAALSFVDADRQWFKSRVGLEASETPREHAFCAHAILDPAEVMIVPDARRDRRFAENPLVTGGPGIRFYAGAPLVTPGGEALGTLCVLDREARLVRDEEVQCLRALSRLAMVQLETRQREVATLESRLEAARLEIEELKARVVQHEKLREALDEEVSFRRAVIEYATEGICVCHSVPTFPYVEFTVWNQRMTEITGHSMEEINRLGWYQTVYPDPEVQERARERMERMRQGEDLRNERWEVVRADGEVRAVGISTSVLTSRDGTAHVLAVIHDFTVEENLLHEAAVSRVDMLTGVYTPRAFQEEAERTLRLASRGGAPVSMAFLDLDDFKAINDERGHAEGDRLLEVLGRVLQDSLRSTDLAGRVGGDEFAILLPNTDVAGARVFFERLRDRTLQALRKEGWSIGLSIGVAVYHGSPPEEAEAVLQADDLMYQAKKQGKNRTVYAEFTGDRNPDD